EIERGPGDLPRYLHLLDPRNVRPYRRPDGKLRLHLKREDKDLLPRDVIEIKMLGWNGFEGYRPIDFARETLQLIKARDGYELALMMNNAAPGGHLEILGDLTDVAMKESLAQWNQNHGGPR